MSKNRIDTNGALNLKQILGENQKRKNKISIRLIIIIWKIVNEEIYLKTTDLF
jgi:hypothetical protein